MHTRRATRRVARTRMHLPSLRGALATKQFGLRCCRLTQCFARARNETAAAGLVSLAEMNLSAAVMPRVCTTARRMLRKRELTWAQPLRHSGQPGKTGQRRQASGEAE